MAKESLGTNLINCAEVHRRFKVQGKGTGWKSSPISCVQRRLAGGQEVTEKQVCEPCVQVKIQLAGKAGALVGLSALPSHASEKAAVRGEKVQEASCRITLLNR